MFKKLASFFKKLFSQRKEIRFRKSGLSPKEIEKIRRESEEIARRVMANVNRYCL